MSIEVQCSCGHAFQASEEAGGTNAACPVCKLFVAVPFLLRETGEPTAVPEPPQSPLLPETPTPVKRRWLDVGPMLQALLTPRAIHGMLTLGGSLCVLGLIVWLASLGVFENKLVLAAALGAGTLSILASGWFTALRTRYRLAGQALTFLASVVAPLNLWFYHAQGLLTLNSGLWVGGVVCCLLYVATVFVLRDPLFMYAVETGVTLTVVLFLGQLGLAANISYLCLALMGLGMVSIHVERAFPPEDRAFSRRRFGLPLFWSGHAQAGAALGLLLVTQLADWLLQPAQSLLSQPWIGHSLTLVASYSGGLLPQSFLLATGLWLAGTYLYLYSDLVVRRVGVYVYLAAFSLLMAEVTLVGRNLQTEVLIGVLALTAVAVHLSQTVLGQSNDKLRKAIPRLALVLSVPPVLMGLMLHVRATGAWTLSETWVYHTTWLFVGAMGIVLVSNKVSALLCRRTDARLSIAYLALGAVALFIGAAGALRLIGVATAAQQAPWLLGILVVYLVAARALGRAWERPLATIAHVAVALILVQLGAASFDNVGSVVQPLPHQPLNLLLGLALAEVALFYSLSAGFQRPKVNVYLATAAACAALWQLLGYWGIPGEYHTMLYAGLGVGFLAASRLLGVRLQTSDRGQFTKLVGRGLPAFQSANAILCIALLAAIMQGLMRLPGLSETPADWLHLRSLLATATAAAVAMLLAPSVNIRRAYATMFVTLGGLTLITLNQLSILSPWQKLEAFSTLVGVLLVVSSYIGRFREAAHQRDELVTLGLWLGSLLATVPLAAAVIYHRTVEGRISLPDELALLTVSILMLLTGFVWQVKSTALHGGVALVTYLVVLVVSLGWQPQLAVGVYLAIGGGLVFAAGIALSVYREQLLEIPDKIANREGIFRIMNWR